MTTEEKEYNFFVSAALSGNTVIHSACFLATKSVIITMQTLKEDSAVFTKTLNLSLETAKELYGELGKFIDECAAYAATEKQNTKETKGF